MPDDPKHVMYVWFDALTNYLTALGFGSDDPRRRRASSGSGRRSTHLVGKEIVRQHALYWPAFLMSAGITPPRRIIAHGWWLMGGAKMSKSIGNVARYQDYVAASSALDALRYFVMREMPLGQDANFSDEAILTRFNADLANDLGNLVSRATTMVHRYRDGVIPASPSDGRDDAGPRSRAAASTRRSTRSRQDFDDVSDHAWRCRTRGSSFGAVNQYIVEREPWALAKDAGPARDAGRDAVSRRRCASGDRRARSIRSCRTRPSAFAECSASTQRAVDGTAGGHARARHATRRRSNRCFRALKRPSRNCAR